MSVADAESCDVDTAFRLMSVHGNQRSAYKSIGDALPKPAKRTMTRAEIYAQAAKTGARVNIRKALQNDQH